jgi:tetratricopeptide (TPR) repeat protein
MRSGLPLIFNVQFRKMQKSFILISMLGLFAASCRKYVDDVPVTNVRTLSTTSDYRLLMNPVGYDGGSVETSLYTYPVLSGDDVYFTDSTYQVNFGTYYAPVYTWAALYYTADQSDLNWETPYAKIYSFNTVITGVMGSSGGTDSVKHEIQAEALVHRAFSYWALVNCYGRQFDSSSAATDPGVPLLLVPSLTASLARASVKEVYDQSIADVKAAIPYLPTLNSYNTYPSKVAAYALLSRIYLFTRNFTAASSYADSALAIQSTIADYNTYVSGSSMTYPARLNDPELIFSKQQSGSFYPLQINPTLVNLLGPTDLRYQLFTRSGKQFSNTWPDSTRIYWRTNYTYEPNNIGLTTPELYLIKAECLARAGDVTDALDFLNRLRQRRYASANYVPATASDAATALALVVNERQRELFGRGIRWFDQKRLNKDAQFAITEVRSFQGVTYTLLPNSNRYAYPIGEKYITLNPEIVQNEE